MRPIDGDALKGPLELQRASYARIGATERAIAYADCLWEIAQAPTIGGWISVKDRLPDAAGYECLVCAVNENTHQTHVFTAFTGYGEPGWWTSNAHYMSRAKSPSDNSLHPALRVTHWMPMPKPPKEEEKSSKDENALARLLTLDELRALPVGAVVWYEQRALLQTYIMPMIVTEDNHIGNWALGVCMDVIGQDDRCWSARPTDEQREATPWRV